MRTVAEVTRILDDEAVIRSEGGSANPAVPEDRRLEAMIGCFTQCQDFLDELQVDLAVDNHGVVTNDGAIITALMKRLDHPRIGSNLDTMNFRWFGNDVAACNAIYADLAPYVKHVHLKDGMGARENYQGRALGDGEIDLGWALDCLRKAGYAGAYAAEYEGPETAGGVGYAKCLSWMKEHV